LMKSVTALLVQEKKIFIPEYFKSKKKFINRIHWIKNDS